MKSKGDELDMLVKTYVASHPQVLRDKMIKLEADLAKANRAIEISLKVLKRLSVIEMPDKPVKGSDFAEYTINQKCQISKEALAQIQAALEGQS